MKGGGTPVKIDIVPISDVFPPRNSSLLNLFVVENASMILQLKPDEFHKSPMSTRPHIILARSWIGSSLRHSFIDVLASNIFHWCKISKKICSFQLYVYGLHWTFWEKREICKQINAFLLQEMHEILIFTSFWHVVDTVWTLQFVEKGSERSRILMFLGVPRF